MTRYQPPQGIIDPHRLDWGKALPQIPDDLRRWPVPLAAHCEEAIARAAAQFPEHRVISDASGCDLQADGKYLWWREVWIGKPGP